MSVEVRAPDPDTGLTAGSSTEVDETPAVN